MQNFRIFFVLLIVITNFSCNKDDSSEEYTPITPVSPVVMDLTRVPYPKLSDYKFFEGEMKNQNPSYGVIPFKPESELFTDYALKKRFVWLPNGTKATYVNDYSIFNFPTGSAVIKNFYYDNVQPSNSRKIIETRIMIKKENGWIYANYVWNDEQTEAFFDLNGSTKTITWTDSNLVSRTIDYEIPKEVTCAGCHTIGTVKKPIGIKPQNLNGNFTYSSGSQNQLAKWIQLGILENNLPSSINSVVNYKDVSKPLELRTRSYFDANCAHCHQLGGYADFFDLKLEFKETHDRRNMGVCVTPNHIIPGVTGRIVTPSNPDRSLLYYRVTTNDAHYRMPFLGRTIVHDEGAQLIREWILSINECP